MAIFTISDEIRQVAMDAFDTLINELSKTCRLYYPPKMQECSNCVVDMIGRKSSNIYLHGGPIPFPFGGMCPMCDGAGYKAIEVYHDVNFLVNENIKSFYKDGLPSNVNLPNGTIQTKGYITDMPKVKRCSHMIKHLALENYQTMNYTLYGEPLSPGNIIQGRYFVALWLRSI